GGIGTVFQAVREADGKLVALKTIQPRQTGQSEPLQRFLRETTVLRALDHPHIISMEDFGEADNLLYIAMAYVPGIDGEKLVEQEGPLGVSRVARLGCQLLEALEYAHARGFVHRDIKPGNLLVSTLSQGEHLRLADFGLARAYQVSRLSGLSLSGAVGGTPAFMAPEQVTHFRDVGPPADLYSVSATLYNLLTAAFTYNFAPTVAGRLSQLLQEDPIPILERRPELPEDLAEIIHRGLARQRKVRFENARTFRRELQRFA
ncbi:MAG: serine/threonine-protein kinase, partial [Gemmataceae bacterium]